MNSEITSSQNGEHAELFTLIDTLRTTENRLLELTHGEVDSVLDRDGQMYLLRHAQTEIRRYEASKQAAILNALPSPVALLDSQGAIISSNRAWQQFVRFDLPHTPGLAVGVNYLENCERARGATSPDARHIAAGIRAVLGDAAGFSTEYLCPSATAPRLLLLTLTPLFDAHPHGVIVMHTDITAQMLAAKQLQSSLEEFRVLAEAMPQIVWITRPDGQNIYFNQHWTDYTGLTGEESLGDGWNKPFHPDDQRQALEAWRKAVALKRPYSIESRLRRADGEYRWWLTRGTPHLNARGDVLKWFGTCTDIHELKEAELKISRTNTELRQSEKRFKTLFELAAVGVALRDVATERFVQVNQRFCDITGRSREELSHLTALDISHPSTNLRDNQLVHRILAGEIREFTVEKRYRHKDGSFIWVNVTVSAMWMPGEAPDHLMAVAQDITERKQLEEQLRQSQKMDAIGTLAGGIAHDFNNILAAISGYTDLSLRKLTGNLEVRDYLGNVLQASKRAINLVQQILAFSRQQKLERDPLKLHSVVAECSELLRATLPSSIEIVTSLAPDAPSVLADDNQIHQILTNLGTNAWHSMADRPGRLQIKLDKIVVDAALAAVQSKLRPGVYAHISVSDTGTGMDPATQQRIFEPFFTTKPPGEGTGLGLSVVHGIMESHEGAITVDSQPGQGTTFHLYFPEYVASTRQIAPEAGAAPRGHGEQLLFVDDEEMLIQLGRQTLSQLGYTVEIANHPAAALALVRAAPSRFALVITDQTMPGMTGLALAHELRKIRPELPIILTSGYSLSLTPERIAAAGIFQLLLKPASIHDLGVAVHAALA